MKKSRIVLNTLIEQSAHDQGKSQVAIVKDLLSLGYTNIELRREYGKNNLDELATLAALKLRYRLTYFYSIPETLFVNGHLNPQLLQFSQEARLLGASYLKLNLGDFEEENIDELSWLERILPSSVQINLENDQTIQNASVQRLSHFFQLAKSHHINIGFVNDLGNWVYTKQDEAKATQALMPYTRYVHLKGYIQKDGKPITTSFVDSQLNWQNLLQHFNADLPVALEYPSGLTALSKDLTTLENFND